MQPSIGAKTAATSENGLIDVSQKGDKDHSRQVQPPQSFLCWIQKECLKDLRYYCAYSFNPSAF